VIEEDKAAHFKKTLREDLERAGHIGIPITPDKVVSAVELIKHDEAESFVNGSGHLYVRASEVK
jgi:hypothetical protein